MEPQKVQPLWVREDLEVIAIEGYSTVSRSPELEPHPQIPFCIIPQTPYLYIEVFAQNQKLLRKNGTENGWKLLSYY